MRKLEGEWIEAERAEIADWAAEAPTNADDFVAWFEALKAEGPGQGDPLFPWLAKTARRDEIKWFITQEVAGEAGFDDLVAAQKRLEALSQLVGRADFAPLAVAFKRVVNIVEKQAEGDLARFKAFIESEGYATGAWRGHVGSGGNVGTPGVDRADASRGDSGKAGVSGKAAAGVAAAAVAGAAAVAATRAGSTKG